jgi:hypothetical protein
MEAYAALLTAMQTLATDAYHIDRESDSCYDREGYNHPLDDVHERLAVALRGVLFEVRDRLAILADKELSTPEITASDHMRSLALSLAVTEVTAYVEGGFCFEPLETRVPEESLTQPAVEAIMKHFEDLPYTPHFMYDASSGVVTSVYGGVKKSSADSSHAPDIRLNEKLQEVGERIRKMRMERGYGVKDVARWVEVHPRCLRDVESGLNSRVGGTQLRQGHWLIQRLADYLDTTVQIIWPWGDDKEKDAIW